MLDITSCTVTNNNGLLLKYSILSIVHHIKEIFIFDDSSSHEYNYILNELSKYKNVKIFKTDIFGKDLGKKKQFLVDNATNEIVMRWDDDFVLYDVNLLYEAFEVLKIPRFKGIVSYNYNFAFISGYLRVDRPYANNEVYIYKKPLITFGKQNNYIDFPIKNEPNAKLKYYDKPIFIHFWNFKSCDKMFFRGYMTPYLIDKISNSYLEWYFKNINENKNIDYNFNTLIKFKKEQIHEIKKVEYNLIDLKKIQKWVDYKVFLKFKRENIELFQYIEKNYQIKFLKNNKFLFIVNETNNISCIQNHKCSITNAINLYIFKNITGISKIKTLKSNFDSDYHYQISNCLHDSLKNNIIWGSGISWNHEINKSLDFVFESQLNCVRGPLSVLYLKNNNIHVEKYGDPILLMSLFYSKVIKKKNFKLGLAYDKEINVNLPSTVKLIEYVLGNKKKYSITSLINSIYECEKIITNNYAILVLCHSYNIPVFYINTDNEICKLLDYIKGVYSFYYHICLNININELITNIEKYSFLYKKPDLLDLRRHDLITSCPFIEDSLKPLLLKMI